MLINERNKRKSQLMRPLCFATWTSSEPLSCSKSTGKSELVGCLLSLKDERGLSKLGGTMTIGRMFPFHLDVRLHVITATPWADPTQGESERERYPVNSIHKMTSPRKITIRFQWSHTFYTYSSASPYNAKGQSTVFIHTNMTCPNHCTS